MRYFFQYEALLVVGADMLMRQVFSYTDFFQHVTGSLRRYTLYHTFIVHTNIPVP